MTKIRFLILAALSLFIIHPAFAQDEAPSDLPSKESFISAWEDAVKSKDTTISFEKTDEEDVYILKTDLFNYDGKLKLLNVLIYPFDGYDYGENMDDYVMGSAEVDFIDEDGDLRSKYPQSFNRWNESQTLYYSKSADKWMNSKEYYKDYEEKLAAIDYPVAEPQQNKKRSKFVDILISLIPVFLILSVFYFFIRKTIKTQKSYMEKYDLSMERQKESLEIQRKAVENQEKSVQQSIVNQEKQIALLEQILKKVSK